MLIQCTAHLYWAIIDTAIPAESCYWVLFSLPDQIPPLTIFPIFFHTGIMARSMRVDQFSSRGENLLLICDWDPGSLWNVLNTALVLWGVNRQRTGPCWLTGLGNTEGAAKKEGVPPGPWILIANMNLWGNNSKQDDMMSLYWGVYR